MQTPQQELQQLTSFFSKYTVNHIDSYTQQLHSLNNTYLIKKFDLAQSSVIPTLNQHYELDSSYILTLVTHHIDNHYQTITYIYQYADISLSQQILSRQSKRKHFAGAEIWAIIYSVTRALDNLQEHNIPYQVLSPERIFIDNKIKIIDPTAITLDPNTSLSYEYLNELFSKETDYFKLDVFIFGLVIIETALLINIQSLIQSYSIDQIIHQSIKQITQLYDQQLAQIVELMLQPIPEARPSFRELRTYLENNLDLDQQNNQSPLMPDYEDLPNQLSAQDQTLQYESIDLPGEVISLCSSQASMNQYEKAVIRFINPVTCFTEQPVYSRASLESQNHLNKKCVTKTIKEKIVKTVDDEILQLKKQCNIVNQKLFTDPQLMKMIKKDLKAIYSRQAQATKQNRFYNH